MLDVDETARKIREAYREAAQLTALASHVGTDTDQLLGDAIDWRERASDLANTIKPNSVVIKDGRVVKIGNVILSRFGDNEEVGSIAVFSITDDRWIELM